MKWIIVSSPPSQKMGISNSIMEYMVLGNRLTATSGDGTNEIEEDQKTDFLVMAHNPEDMPNKIDWL